jgi:23S rRNA (cytidine2498-2'-O)-methyltransferase
MPWHPQFLFAVCQCGAEPALKQELAASHPELKFSFSRPGFVTFKFAEPCQNAATYQLKSTFARTWGFSLGKVTGNVAHELATAT